MKSFNVNASPEVLEWARKSSGLTQEEAARKLGVLLSDVVMWEEGVTPIPFDSLRAAAKLYSYPLAVLLLPDPPSGIQVLRDFRQLPQNRGSNWSPALNKQFRRISYQQQVAAELAEALEEPVATFNFSLSHSESVTAAGTRLRDWILASHRSEIEPRVEALSFRTWSSLIEERGVLITQVEGVALEEMRGFSISSKPIPAIAINGKDSLTGKLFTLVHELVHICMHERALCDMASSRNMSSNPVSQVERFCDEVAAEVLMPAALLNQNPIVLAAGPRTEWSIEQLRTIASPFYVSPEAVLRRLATLGKTSTSFYWSMRPRFEALYQELKEQEAKRLEESTGGPSPYRMKIRNLGRRFISEVFEAYDRDLIELSDVSDYLDIKVHNIPKLAARMAE